MEATTVFSQAIQYFKKIVSCEIKKEVLITLENENIFWILTVPAIWGDTARLFMGAAAIKV